MRSTGKERLQLEQWMSEMYDRREPNPLPAGIVEALYGEKTWASITTLGKICGLRLCTFFKRGTPLEERKPYELLPPDLGNILHQSMERFSKAVEASDYTWADMPDDFRDETMEACVRDTGMEYQSAVFLENARYGYYLEQLVRMAKRTAWTIQKQIWQRKLCTCRIRDPFYGGGPDKPCGNGGQV